MHFQLCKGCCWSEDYFLNTISLSQSMVVPFSLPIRYRHILRPYGEGFLMLLKTRGVEVGVGVGHRFKQ